jgi:hypothetical protein
MVHRFNGNEIWALVITGKSLVITGDSNHQWWTCANHGEAARPQGRAAAVRLPNNVVLIATTASGALFAVELFQACRRPPRVIIIRLSL